jgi:hypothetical protein
MVKEEEEEEKEPVAKNDFLSDSTVLESYGISLQQVVRDMKNLDYSQLDPNIRCFLTDWLTNEVLGTKTFEMRVDKAAEDATLLLNEFKKREAEEKKILTAKVKVITDNRSQLWDSNMPPANVQGSLANLEKKELELEREAIENSKIRGGQLREGLERYLMFDVNNHSITHFTTCIGLGFVVIQ